MECRESQSEDDSLEKKNDEEGDQKLDKCSNGS
jgi:hypothetical protein